MGNNKFWGIVVGILVVFLAGLGYVFVGPYAAASEEEEKLGKTVRKLERYAGEEDLEKLPTERLVEVKKTAASRWESQLEEVVEFYEERDERFEEVASQQFGVFGAWLSDAFTRLEEEYREKTGLAAEKALPFDRPQDPGSDSEVLAAQKRWNILDAFVRATLAANGEVVEYDFVSAARANVVKRADFDTMRIKARIDVPLAKVDEFIEILLEDDTINFEIAQLVIGKRRPNLQQVSIQTVSYEDPSVTKEAVTTEPPVRAYVEFDVLDWNPKSTDDEKKG